MEEQERTTVVSCSFSFKKERARPFRSAFSLRAEEEPEKGRVRAVSYTHLTLPTIA